MNREDLAPDAADCVEPRRDILPRPEQRKVDVRWSVLKRARDHAAVVVIVIVIAVLFRTFLFAFFAIPSESMEPTMTSGDHILVSTLSPASVQRGDVVVFTDPGGWLPDDVTGSPNFLLEVLAFVGLVPADGNSHIVKRVIGLPGDHIACCEAAGQLSVNGVPIAEGYIDLPEGIVAVSGEPFDVTVPAESLWVMGDSRYNSADSRSHANTETGGFVPVKRVVGRAVFVTWPLTHLRLIPQLPNDQLPAP